MEITSEPSQLDQPTTPLVNPISYPIKALVCIFLALSLISNGYLFYQYSRLKNQIVDSPTSPTPIAQLLPTATPQDNNQVVPTDILQPTTVPADNRILLTLENERLYNSGTTTEERCIKFNTDPANTYVNYRNQDKGLSIEMPFNQKWGNDQYRIDPYEVVAENQRVHFSYVMPLEGCSWYRPEYLTFLPQKSLTESIQEIESEFEGDCRVTTQVIVINEMDVIKYEPPCGMAYFVYYRVIGEKFNYELFSSFNQPERVTELENMIKTIKFI